MSILDRAKQHYAGMERQTIDVAEWGEPGKPLIISFTALTVGERRRIFRADKHGVAPDGPTAAVRALIVKARDADGKPMFNDMDEHDLTYKVDSAIVGRIARAILQDVETDGDADDLVEQEKNG